MAYTTINKSTDYFNIKLYTGNASTRSITGVGFQPDMVWTKSRGNSNNHNIYDVVRGATKRIYPNSTTQEATTSNTLTSFDSDGFSLGDQDNVNANGITMASWNWKAGGTGSANTDGDINSTVSVNTISKFSIVKWTGNGTTGTVGHGLGVAPKIVIYKKLNGSSDWYVWTTVIDNSDDDLRLNTTGTKNDISSSGSITSSTISNYNWGGSDNMIAYCFAEVPGFSKIGSYVGHTTTNGTDIYCGFKPKWVMIKGVTTAEGWVMFDAVRNPNNIVDKKLIANGSSAENTSAYVDFNSTGFKFRTDNNEVDHANTYTFIAFGQSIVASNNIPATAR